MDFPQKFNVLVTGTPGCGKTSLCQMLQDELGLIHIEVSKVLKDEKFYTEFDPAYDSYIIEQEDEDRLLDYLEPVLVKGGCCVDYHGCDLFPRRWFGMVLVLRSDTEKIFDRLVARGYSEAKREENMDAEIMGVCEEEARQSYHETIVVARKSNEITDMISTVEVVRKWRNEWTPEKQEFVTLDDIGEDDNENNNYNEDDDAHNSNNNNQYNNDDYGDENGREKLRQALNNIANEGTQQKGDNNNNNGGNNNTNNNNQQEQFEKMQQQQQQSTMSKN